MKKILLLVLLAFIVATAVAQSGRKNVRPITQPAPPIQAPIFSQPDPEPVAAAAMEMAESGLLPESFRAHPIRALDDSNFRLSDFGGKVVVVNLWASWCGPCRAEIPEYEKVRKEYAGHAVEFIGLTTEDPVAAAAKVKQFARSANFGFRLGWADRETTRALMKGRGIPQTLVITPDGRVAGHWNGYSRGQSGDHLRATIEGALSAASLP